MRLVCGTPPQDICHEDNNNFGKCFSTFRKNCFPAPFFDLLCEREENLTGGGGKTTAECHVVLRLDYQPVWPSWAGRFFPKDEKKSGGLLTTPPDDRIFVSQMRSCGDRSQSAPARSGRLAPNIIPIYKYSRHACSPERIRRVSGGSFQQRVQNVFNFSTGVSKSLLFTR